MFMFYIGFMMTALVLFIIITIFSSRAMAQRRAQRPIPIYKEDQEHRDLP